MIKINFKYVLLAGLLVTFSAEAKVATMTWFLNPNKTMGKTISAISPYLSAKCQTDISTGRLLLIINGQKRTLTPSQNYASFSRINGSPQGGGKNSYSYSIHWNTSDRPAGSFTLTCQGDNHRST